MILWSGREDLNLSRFAGVSAAGARRRNPERSEGPLANDSMVGERGFEPPTPWSRTRCSTRLSHSPTRATAARNNIVLARENADAQENYSILAPARAIAASHRRRAFAVRMAVAEFRRHGGAVNRFRRIRSGKRSASCRGCGKNHQRLRWSFAGPVAGPRL